MGLETSTYISGLTSAWPVAGDPKSQGDDHLRLIKGVLQSTFPNASKPFYIAAAESTSTTLALDATDQNNVVAVTTTGGDVSVTLPSGFDSTKAGWSCEVVKVSADVNAAVVTISGGGNIVSRVGSTASIRVGAFAEPCRFLWTGVAWIAVKPGLFVGSSFSWDGATVPFGCLVLDGTAFNTTTFAELSNALGTGTLRDKRGRTEVGVDTATNRLATAMAGQQALGGTGGTDTHTLTAGQIAGHTHNATTGTENQSLSHSHGVNTGVYGGTSVTGATSGAGIIVPIGVSAPAMAIGITAGGPGAHNHSLTTDTGAGVFGQAHPNVQPTIVVQRLIRAC